MSEQGIGTFSNRVWRAWGFALLAGWVLLGFGLVTMAYTPDLWRGTPTPEDPAWGLFAMGLVTAGAVLIVVATVKAESRYLALKASARDQAARRERRRQKVLMGVAESGRGDARGARGNVLVRGTLLACVLLVATAGVLGALGIDVPLLRALLEALASLIPGVR